MDIIKVLIENDADLSIKNENGHTPRELALELKEASRTKGNLEIE